MRDIANIAINYFSELFTTSSPTKAVEVVKTTQRYITKEMNEQLTKDFQKEEIIQAISQMHPTKAPSLDGMSAMFYQKYWNIIGEDVCNIILNTLNTNASLANLNKTNIVLIPKTNRPTRMSEFRPISLCNVLYKIISKVLANRLKLILNSIISENQSAFVPERLITDNVLVGFEIMHYLKKKRNRIDGFMVVKLDMRKAYNRVEWVFLEKIMEKMGFNNKWICLMMNCISSVSYSILINGVIHGCIVPTRGLRQGDPLSPYLFLLCAKGLTGLIVVAARNKRLSGISIRRGSPSITHLLFADDSVIYCKAFGQESKELQIILQKYEEATGQRINTEKSSIFFSQNTDEETKKEVREILGAMQDTQSKKYLSLPSLIGRSKKRVVTEIKERVGKKLSSWKEKLLSIGGREILIKVVVQAVPTYSMGCFLLPKGLCEEIEGMVRNFWWGQRNNESKMAWVGWSKMCKSKLEGGMGFQDLQAFNLAMLAKQGWRMLFNSSSLMTRMYKAKYFPNGDILNASLGNQPSYAWKSIHKSLEVLKQGTGWRVGSGKKIHIWDDKWLPTPTTYKVISPTKRFWRFPNGLGFD
ncbi:hypothetical protein SO802_028031 [Lithocarpus litseifolius]|uniref:Reverse transcriptase domain-containing protein n=1 Tax=Lithocarpus litseifolius TaxID=425828 RepID=A0AAW2BPS9_9ROSI